MIMIVMIIMIISNDDPCDDDRSDDHIDADHDHEDDVYSEPSLVIVVTLNLKAD